MNQSFSSRPTILIVDDNPTNLGVIVDFLETSDFEVATALDGEDGLATAYKAHPDLILLDIMMPGLDGIEVCRRLKADTSTQHIPVIFMTALASSEDKVRGFEVGAVDYITKPFYQEEVLARISLHLRIQELTHNLQAQNARLQEVTAELEDAVATLSKRATQLETSSQVGQQVTFILDLDELLDRVVRLIQARFGYYAVSIWLVTPKRESVTLCAGWIAGNQEWHRLDMNFPMDSFSIVVQVCRTGVFYLANDVCKDPYYKEIAQLPATRSELALPLRMGQEIIGALDIQSDQVDAFNADDRMVLQTLADQVAAAIRNAQLYRLEQRRRQVAESIEQIGRVLSSSLDPIQVSDHILAQLASVLPYTGSAVILSENDIIRIVARRDFFPDQPAVGVDSLTWLGDVFHRLEITHTPLVLDDVSEMPARQRSEWLLLHKSWLGMPLIAKDKVIGMILLTRRETAAFNQDDAALVSAFAPQAAIALENARLYDEIRHFSEQLEMLVQQRTEELDKAYQVLERMDRAKSDFIKVASHELRTPLALIKGYTMILEPETADNPTIHTLVQGILSGQNRLQEIVNNLLDISKIDSQALDVHMRPTYLQHVIQSVCSAFEVTLEERQLTLTVTSIEDLPEIQADPDLMFKLFYNLIVNAIKYTQDSGQVWVSGKMLVEAGGESWINLSVSDTGIGIDPTYHELVFEKFFHTGDPRLHSSGKTKFKGGGPGLGLAIARGIVQAHGGRIWVESRGYDEQGCPGSTFYVLLPVNACAG